MRFSLVRAVAPLVLLVHLAACGSDGPTAGGDPPPPPPPPPPPAQTGLRASTWIIAGSNGRLDATTVSMLQSLAGAPVTVLDPIGLAIVDTDVAGFADAVRALAGVRAILRDPAPPAQAGSAASMSDGFAMSPSVLGTPAAAAGDPMFDGQWGLRAIDAPGAWSLGATGRGARVFILDSGIDRDHPDLAANLNVALSRSFVPNQPVFVAPGNVQHHGTLVAGVIAAAQNGVGITGVAPEAEIVALRILGNDFVRFGDVIQALVYAADNGADVISMQFGIHFPRSGGQISERPWTVTAAEATELISMVTLATNYAHAKGATLAAAAGNSSLDFDLQPDMFVLPTDLPHVIAVAATTTSRFAFDANADPDRWATYNNRGGLAIDIAAPGGEFGTWNPQLTTCTVATITFPCQVFDGVLTTANGGGYRYGSGTSMAAPHVSGVAALLIGLNGGAMDPDAVESLLVRGARDLGAPGRDGEFGAGRVNAAASVALLLH